MKAEIYYFSSTGNTLLLAREGARRLGAQLIPISSFKPLESVNTRADIIGFYFPVYHASFNEPGIPYFIRDFIKSFRGLKKRYVFAVCTHSGFPGFTLRNLDLLLKTKGVRLSAGMDAKLGIPYTLYQKLDFLAFNTPLTFSEEKENQKREELLVRFRSRAERTGFYDKIREKEPCRLWYDSPAGAMVREILLKLQRKGALKRFRALSHFGGDEFKELIRFADRSFTLSDDCIGCGLCADICPVGNIEMKEGKPEWLHMCENCYSCFQWCPVRAIGGPVVAFEKRYHQPSVAVKDLLADDPI